MLLCVCSVCVGSVVPVRATVEFNERDVGKGERTHTHWHRRYTEYTLKGMAKRIQVHGKLVVSEKFSTS